MPLPRIAITGLGVVTPLGSTPADLWAALCAGRSGVRPLTAYPGLPDELAGDDAPGGAAALAEQPVRIAATVPDFDPLRYLDRKRARQLDRCSQLAVAAARLALADAGLDAAADPGAVGVCVGSGVGCLAAAEAESAVLRRGGPRRVSPFAAAMILPSMPAAQVSIQLGLRGPARSISTACATGADNVAAGADLIWRGAARAVLAGGAEAAVTPLGMAAFAASRSLSRNNAEPEQASRPFDRRRDGFVMGEGAGVVVLEELAAARARGARVYAELRGAGSTSDAHHLTAPREDGSGLVAAMRLALRAAGLPPEAVDYVNAHGTSTPLNDRVETQALKEALGDHARRIPISSTKSMLGHLLGAAGAVELAVTVLTLRHGFVHPTINLEEPDPACDLDYVPGVGRAWPARVAMSNSLAFGGHNASLVVGLPEE